MRPNRRVRGTSLSRRQVVAVAPAGKAPPRPARTASHDQGAGGVPPPQPRQPRPGEFGRRDGVASSPPAPALCGDYTSDQRPL